MSFAAPYNRPRCCNTGGGFLLLCASLDLLSGIDAFDKFFSALDGVAPNVMLSRNGLCCISFNKRPILGQLFFRI